MHFCRLGEVMALKDVTCDTLRRAQVGRKHWSSTVTVARDWWRFKSLQLLVSSLASPRWLGDTFLIVTQRIARRTSSPIFRNSVILQKWEHVSDHEVECSFQEPSGGQQRVSVKKLSGKESHSEIWLHLVNETQEFTSILFKISVERKRKVEAHRTRKIGKEASRNILEARELRKTRWLTD